MTLSVSVFLSPSPQYKIQKVVLLIQKLNLSVWHNDSLGRNSFLGEMEIDLASWDWRNNKLNWYMLKPRVSAARLIRCFRGWYLWWLNHLWSFLKLSLSWPFLFQSLSAINGVDHRGVMNLSIKYVPPGSLGKQTTNISSVVFRKTNWNYQNRSR